MEKRRKKQNIVLSVLSEFDDKWVSAREIFEKIKEKYPKNPFSDVRTISHILNDFNFQKKGNFTQSKKYFIRTYFLD